MITHIFRRPSCRQSILQRTSPSRAMASSANSKDTTSTTSIDLESISTPPLCLADFCLIPMGTGSPSVSAQVADVQRLVEKSGLKYVLHSAGTTLEGPWDKVFQVIGQAHTMIHEQGCARVQTDVRIGTRTDKMQSFEDKVNKVHQLLGQKH